jgi:GNAT superfamily N-acetyltransferase
MGTEPIAISADGTPDEMARLGDELDAFNTAATGAFDEKPLRIVARDGTGKMIAGLKGMTGWGWLYVIVLWVEQSQRGNGLGTKLMDAAEQEAIARGCHGACLSSFSFQAPEFYRRRGYEAFGELKDYPQGHTMYFMRKRLR